MKFTLHTIESAPEASKPLLEKSQQAFGNLPGLHQVMAEAPAVLAAYQQLHELFLQTSFNAEELTVVWQTINVEHKCHYCVPAHTAIAHMMKVDPALTEALRNGDPMPNAKLQTLHDTTLEMVRNRGHISEEQLAAFEAAGYGPQQLLEITLGLSQKVMSNYINHFAETPVDKAFQQYAWTPNQ
ncbi:carboxymuconolactone decarboxylase family protein [Microbulbifer thermotolerans]|uniref:carboxymuconolactone decarboxylase family protein n=1 Tax=Microbulbifer thermotolerans TaxID=252514 RepID=UPI00224AF658|nr:carboxymuconolactone decarboxylase family protein [Microbulbifer thermotolerans]MCX2840914.1 carboxymuconolactone decarboxylase family protein [Microbulbifer thermotolerans]